MKPKFEIGERICSEACGNARVTDIFISITKEDKRVYEVTTIGDSVILLYNEEDL